MRIPELIRNVKRLSSSRMPPKPSGGIDIRTVRVLKTGDIFVQLRHKGVTVSGSHTVSIVLRNPERVEKGIAKKSPNDHFLVKRWWFLTVGARYFKKLKYRDVRVQFNCNCPDFYFTWGIWVYNKGDLIGQKPPPYRRLTPPPPAGRPYRNPGKIPGGCKHVLNSIQFLRKKGYLKL